MGSLSDFFPTVFLINRDADADRMARVMPRLERIGIRPERFAALTPEDCGQVEPIGNMTPGHW